jgi:hypothetical protein
VCFAFLGVIFCLDFDPFFFFLGLLIVGFAFLGVIFCLDFDPFFFFSSLVPLPSVFPLFIY